MRIIYGLMLGLFFLSIQAQTTNENLNTQLYEMKNSFLNGDYQKVVKYSLPKVVEMMGGEQQMIEATQTSMESMKAQGFVVEDISFSEASPFVTQNGVLQCSLTQELIMETPEGKIQNKTSIIAVSRDDGENWNFLDASGMPIDLVKTIFPDLHPDISIKESERKNID